MTVWGNASSVESYPAVRLDVERGVGLGRVGGVVLCFGWGWVLCVGGLAAVGFATATTD